MSKKQKTQRSPKRMLSPSTQTVYRFSIHDYETRQRIDRETQAFAPELWERDRPAIEQIQRAKTPAALLDLAAQATGMADAVWSQRVRQFGPDIVPLITHRLKTSRDIADPKHQTLVREHLIAVLRWRGTLGAQVLQECFGDLDEYAQSLAAIVLGILHARDMADPIWDLFQRTKQNPENYFVGALWGLLDLNDARIADALAELIELGRVYYEMFGFLARSGDARALLPMAQFLVQGDARERESAGYTMSAIVQRVGREQALAALQQETSAEQHAMIERTVTKLLEFPLDAIREYYELYYGEIFSIA